MRWTVYTWILLVFGKSSDGGVEESVKEEKKGEKIEEREKDGGVLEGEEESQPPPLLVFHTIYLTNNNKKWYFNGKEKAYEQDSMKDERRNYSCEKAAEKVKRGISIPRSCGFLGFSFTRSAT